MSLNKKLKELEDKLKEEEVDEANVTGTADGPYNTPYAFGKKKKKDIEVLGYKKVKESKFMTLAKTTFLNERSYKEYKKDETYTSKQKVNNSIKEINSKLAKIERIVNQNIKLKSETGVDRNSYWKSTRSNLQKIAERMARITERLRRF
tara:strand:- start:451 stop:897 length:447 start_codon:yes stop_codon:yes gene_type:complete